MLALTRYGPLGASSRLRSLQYFPALLSAGIDVNYQPLFNDSVLSERYQRGHYGIKVILKCFVQRIKVLIRRRQFDLLWIEKEALPWLPLWVESALLRNVPYVLDFDDAVFHNYDKHRLAWVRFFYGRRLDNLMKNAALVITGNDYLAQRAHMAGSPCVEVIPTVIDLERYRFSKSSLKEPVRKLPIIVWIGSPSTVRYLEILHKPLQLLAQRHHFVLRIIGAVYNVPGVEVEYVQWSEETEVDSIAAGDIGIMPLFNTPWEQGKCGYKLIQYMACGLPVVASRVGVNGDIVTNGFNGYLANEDFEWLDSLDKMLSDPDLRTKMGREGRKLVEDKYCLQVAKYQMISCLRRAAKK